ncbi:MAG: septum formation initiator family protein, partial [Anaerolineaceae bacterium]|nr:septum formation initiator family protein [Anaerolineaceae bacterium]MDD5368058.1 septum formation initiator family protein [Anaerolineaceae bacterium]
KRFHLADRRILWAAALVVLILLMMDFNNRMGEMLRLNDQRKEMGAHMTQLVATQQYLKEQIAYATSDVAVQEWARQEGHMIQPGDVPIVPVEPSGQVTPTPGVEAPIVQTVQNWQVWEALFFGE